MILARPALIGLTVAAAIAGSASSASAQFVTVVEDTGALADAFCAADRSTQHIFVVPTAAFSDGATIECDFGIAALRSVEDADDPGHAVFNIDPVANVADSFDCDGKADMGMSLVGLSCLPENLESADHTKP